MSQYERTPLLNLNLINQKLVLIYLAEQSWLQMREMGVREEREGGAWTYTWMKRGIGATVRVHSSIEIK